MAGSVSKWWCWRVILGIVLICFLVLGSVFVVAEPSFRQEVSLYNENEDLHESNYLRKAFKFLEQKKGQLRYKHDWPEIELGWRIVVGTVIGFFGAAFGSVGGVGGGGMFVPMLSLIIGFDAKSSTAISKCMITGASVATVYYNINLRHPTLELPIIDYDLALLFQPMLVLGISIGVAFNVIFSDWMISVLLIVIFLVMSTKAFLKGVETWKKTIIKKEASGRLESDGNVHDDVEYKPPPGDPTNSSTQTETKESKNSKNVYWKELGLLVAIWVIILALQIAKNYSTTCSFGYWGLNLLQIPVAVGVSSYEAVSLYKGRRKIASKGEAITQWKVHKLVLYCVCGVVAGIIGGLLGLGGGFILGPLFLELGIPPQVSSATATFAMTFSASMSVVEYYLLKRFPVPYALYLAAVATISALVGQHVVRKAIHVIGRASIIIFILAGMIFLSAISLGGVGVANLIKKIERKEYMGFDNICSYHT